MAILTRGLTTWRAEIDSAFPGRDRASDGWIAGGGHTVTGTGHVGDKTGDAEYKDGDAKDEVRAIDVDTDLVPGSAIDWAEVLVQFVVQLARAGIYVPFRYFIYKGRIWRRANGWKTEVYTGSNQHTEHVHFSGDYTEKADEWTGSLGLRSLRGGDMLIRQGDTGEQVMFWQRLMNYIGYSVGDVDGDYGPKMAAAINKFRRVVGGATADISYLSGWQAWTMLANAIGKLAREQVADALSELPAPKDGAPGKDGEPGRDGRDGVLSGILTITGGTFTAVAPPAEDQG